MVRNLIYMSRAEPILGNVPDGAGSPWLTPPPPPPPATPQP